MAPLDERADAYLPNKYLRGFLGALLGALIGSIAWVAIGMLGYIAAIGGLAISFCAVKGYQILKGKTTGVSLVLILAASLAALALAEFATIDIAVYRDVVAQGYEVDTAKLIGETFQIPFYDSESTMQFLKDMAMGIIFMAIGGWSIFKSVLRASKDRKAAIQG